MSRKIFPVLIALLLVSCNQPQPLTDQEIIATFSAATLTARPQQGTLPADTPAPAVTQATAAPSAGGPTPTAAPTETSTATPTATLTTTSTPTATLTPTLAPDDPVSSLGVPTFKDTFQTAGNFYTYNESQSSFQIEEGEFILTAKKANSYETWSLSWAELKNFYLEITGTFGEECRGKDRYGIIFRAPDTDQGYLLSITCDGTFRLSSWDGEDYEVIRKFTASEHIQSGPGGTNRLGIKAKDSKLKVFINGVQVLNINDSQFTKGRFGVLVAASETPGFQAALSQVVYWKLP